IRAKWREPLATLAKERLEIQARELEHVPSTTKVNQIQAIQAIQAAEGGNKCEPIAQQSPALAETPTVVQSTVAKVPICPVPITIGASSVSHRLATLLKQSEELAAASSKPFLNCSDDTMASRESSACAHDLQPSPSEPVETQAKTFDTNSTFQYQVDDTVCKMDTPTSETQQEQAHLVVAKGPHHFPIAFRPNVRYNSNVIPTAHTKRPIISVPMDTAQVSTALAKAMFGIVSGIAQMARRIRSESSRHVDNTK
ncbi:hypothetical protein BCR44DRAFT_51781, partial [Catenaria anguillulae PL171]